ncbi:MAG: amidohydrolase family protein [Dehalococcoidia bacterium]|nr:amidohydrolase family protein [Dehalococcoidia bacterium]
MTVIDAHTHIFAPAQRDARAAIAERDRTFAEMYGDPAAKMATVGELREAMASAGVDRAVVAGFAFSHPEDIAAQDEAILAAAAESAGALVPFPTLNPALPGWRAVAEELLGRGARGFGELRPANQGWDPLGPAAHELCDLAAAHGAVLLWHTSETVGHSYPGKCGGISAEELCRLASAHPGTRMIAAHQGAGLPFFVQMPEIRSALANVWFDTAASSLLYDEASIARLVGLAGAERVVFGSDYPLLLPGRQLHRIRASLQGEAAEAVCGRTAANLLSDTRTR